MKKNIVYFNSPLSPLSVVDALMSISPVFNINRTQKKKNEKRPTDRSNEQQKKTTDAEFLL